MSLELIRQYFAAFNAGDADGMCALVSDDIAHFVNQGEVRTGRAAFEEFLAEMDRAYTERAEDLVVFEGDTPGRFSAEFTIHGVYKATQDGLPEASGQTYVLPVGSFFTVSDGKIARVATHYNLADWTAQVGA